MKTSRLITEFIFASLVLLHFPAWSAESGQTRLQESVQLLKEGRSQESRVLLLQIVKQEPRNAVAWFNLGIADYQLRNFNGAVQAFSRVEELGSPLTSAASLYKARAQQAQGQNTKAQQTLQKLLRDPNLKPAIAEMAAQDLQSLTESGDSVESRALELYRQGKYQAAADLIQKSKLKNANLQTLRELALIQIDRQREFPDRRGWVFLEFASGYDSNAFLDPDANDNKTASFIIQTFLGAGTQLWRGGHTALYAGYTGQWEEFGAAKELQTISHQVQTFVSRDTGLSLAQIGLFYQYDSWAGDDVRSQVGGRLRYRLQPNPYEAGVDLTIASAHAIHDTLPYLAGTLISGRLYGGAFSNPFYGQIFLDFDQQNTGNATYADGSLRPLAYTGLGPGVRLVWRLSENWILAPQFRFTWRKYPTAAQPENKERRDKESALSLRLTYTRDASLSVYTSLDWFKNQSTLGAEDSWDENHSDLRALLGVIWDVF